VANITSELGPLCLALLKDTESFFLNKTQEGVSARVAMFG